jgi:lipopolysaccharide/colanic/teichoic acid biosynthesis glycosyltransferase
MPSSAQFEDGARGEALPDLDQADREVWLKVAFDLGLAFVLLVLFAPVILLAAAAIRLTSAGPAFYLQTRLGRGGRPFRIIKLRTMYHDCEKKSGVRWATPGDSRITRLGRFLRATHLDELPQLINVLRGEMSLVGPRPERPEITPALEATIPNYRERLRVRPGVTGLAQLRLPADTCVVGVRRKLAYDLHYIHASGLWLDLRLMACTVIKMTGIPPAFVLKLCGVPGPSIVGLTDPAAGDREAREQAPQSPNG